MFDGAIFDAAIFDTGAVAPPSGPTPAGGGASGGKAANDEWQARKARKRWGPEVARWLADQGDEAATPTVAPNATPAPEIPRVAGPTLSIAQLLERAEGLPSGAELTRALVTDELERIALAAYVAEQAVLQEEETIATLMMMLAA